MQGQRSALEVIEAVERLDRHPDVDVIVVARGGGSVEDLLPFSDEGLVRAVHAVRTPVVSAIGHEPDSPLLDLVADVRASTPTDAAKRVVPDVAEELQLVATARDRLRSGLGRPDRPRAAAASTRCGPGPCSPTRARSSTSAPPRSPTLRDRSRRSLRHALDRAADNLDHQRARVRALSPLATLERGYAVLQDADGPGRRRRWRAWRPARRSASGSPTAGCRRPRPGSSTTGPRRQGSDGDRGDPLRAGPRGADRGRPRLEAGGLTLEESLALWERGEKLATVCQTWLDGARERLEKAIAPDDD